jgi:uncharacterized membrane protein
VAVGEQSARVMGYFSLGLGTLQCIAPGAVAKFVGIHAGPRTRVLMRLVGLRELTAAAGILTQRRPGQWLWARVAGDVMDLLALGLALTSGSNKRQRVAAAFVAVAGTTAADLQSAEWLTDGSDAVPGLRVTEAITVNRSPEDVYRFWRNFANFPRFMKHLVSVEMTGDRTSHWVATGPAGKSVDWDAETTADRPSQMIAWRSLPGAGVENSGEVRFSPAPGGRGTEIRVDLQYQPPLGVLGAAVARVFGQEPRIQVVADLRRLKQVLEVGEVIVSEAARDGAHIFQHAAQPIAARETAQGHNRTEVSS